MGLYRNTGELPLASPLWQLKDAESLKECRAARSELTDPADVLELLGADIVGVDKEELVICVEQVAELLIILHTIHTPSAKNTHGNPTDSLRCFTALRHVALAGVMGPIQGAACKVAGGRLTTSFLASLLVDGILREGHKQGQTGYSTGRQL